MTVGLFPLNVEKSLARDGAVATGIWSNATPATDMMGIVIPGQQQVVAAKQATAIVEKARKIAEAHHEAATVRAALEGLGFRV